MLHKEGRGRKKNIYMSMERKRKLFIVFVFVGKFFFFCFLIKTFSLIIYSSCRNYDSFQFRIVLVWLLYIIFFTYKHIYKTYELVIIVMHSCSFQRKMATQWFQHIRLTWFCFMQIVSWIYRKSGMDGSLFIYIA